eukprot:gene8377-17748_t
MVDRPRNNPAHYQACNTSGTVYTQFMALITAYAVLYTQFMALITASRSVI